MSYQFDFGVCQRWCAFDSSRLQVADIKTDFLLVNMITRIRNSGFEGSTDGSMFGHACASKSISVASMDWVSDVVYNILPRASSSKLISVHVLPAWVRQ